MNKNTKRNWRKALKRASKGERVTTVEIPRTHKGSQIVMEKRNITIASMAKDGTVSQNTRRNMRMRILHNKGQGMTGNCSATVHEPIDKKQQFFPKKRRDLKTLHGNTATVSAEGIELDNVKIS